MPNFGQLNQIERVHNLNLLINYTTEMNDLEKNLMNNFENSN